MNKFLLGGLHSCLLFFLKPTILLVIVGGGITLSSQAALHEDLSSPWCPSLKRPLSLATASDMRGRIQTIASQINAITQRRAELYNQIKELDSQTRTLEQMKRSFDTQSQKFDQLVVTVLKQRQKGTNAITADSFETSYQEYILPAPSFLYDSFLYLDVSLVAPDLATDDRQTLRGILRNVSGILNIAVAGRTLLEQDLRDKKSIHLALSEKLTQEGLTPEKLNHLTSLQKSLQTDLLALKGPLLISFSRIANCLTKYAQALDLLEPNTDQTPMYSSLLKLFAKYGYIPAQQSVV